MQRRKLTRSERWQVYDKCKGHCAYCGCNLEYKDMQVDHIKSIYANTDIKHTMTDEEMYSEDNFLPACRQCNFYKSSMDLEIFRKRLSDTLMKNLQKTFQYRIALKYGLIEEHIKPIKFYFETINEKSESEKGD